MLASTSPRVGGGRRDAFLSTSLLTTTKVDLWKEHGSDSSDAAAEAVVFQQEVRAPSIE
jgi:hypothetical protein